MSVHWRLLRFLDSGSGDRMQVVCLSRHLLSDVGISGLIAFLVALVLSVVKLDFAGSVHCHDTIRSSERQGKYLALDGFVFGSFVGHFDHTLELTCWSLHFVWRGANKHSRQSDKIIKQKHRPKEAKCTHELQNLRRVCRGGTR